MNDMNPAGSPVPPPIVPPRVSESANEIPDSTPVTGVVGAIECLLRQPRRIMYHLRQPQASTLIISLFFIAVVCALIYGAVVGTFAGGAQLWAGPVKVACGLVLSALICLPSLYIFSALSGSQARLVEVVGLIAGFLALSAVLLIGFAPVAWVFSQSTGSASVMGALHLLFWFTATIFGLRFLYQGFTSLGSRNTIGLKVWMFIYLLVALQMTTAVRPLLEKSNMFLPALTEKKFFLQHWGDNLREQRPN